MTKVATTRIADAYAARFSNLDEISHPAIFHLPEFGALMQSAIDRGEPLTQSEVESKFGPQSWEW